jgi:hypothetical protein
VALTGALRRELPPYSWARRWEDHGAEVGVDDAAKAVKSEV